MSIKGGECRCANEAVCKGTMGWGVGEERHHGCRAAHAHVYRGRAESRHWTELQTRASFVDMKISWSLGLVNWLQSLLRDLSGASEWVADINMNSRAQLINEFLNADRARTEHWKTTWQEPLVSKWDELLYLALIENFTETPDFHKHRFPWVCKALINWWTTVSQTQVFVLYAAWMNLGAGNPHKVAPCLSGTLVPPWFPEGSFC